MRLHLYLEEILANLIPLYFRQTWILHQNPCCLILLNYVRVDDAGGVVCGHNSTALIRLNRILTNKTSRIDHHNSIIIRNNLIILNQQFVFRLNTENPLTLPILNVIILDPRMAGHPPTQCNIGFYVGVDFVGDYASIGAFDYQNSLVEVLHDHVWVMK